MKETSSKISDEQLASYYRQASEKRKNYLSGIDKIILPLIKGKNSLVDLGAGDGVRARNLSKEAGIGNVLLVENSREMLDRIKLVPGVKVKEGSIVDFKPDEKYDVATCLWNVLGHLETVEDIKRCLINADKNILNEGGLFFFDVNNRYNISSYGAWQVAKNMISDIAWPNKNRFTQFSKMISGRRITMTVHFFSPYEIERYISNTSLKIIKKLYINYETGKPERSFWKGQILYIMEKIPK